MTTLTDIQFDQNLFSQWKNQTVTLYKLNEGVSLFIPLTNIDALTFLRHFNEIIDCQDWIRDNPRNIFALFTYSDNIETWLWNNNLIPDNIDQIIIFCPLNVDKNYLRNWTRRYTPKIRKVITYQQLLRELLLHGLEFIENICEDFNGNPNTFDELKEYKNRIRLALINVYAQQMNT